MSREDKKRPREICCGRFMLALQYIKQEKIKINWRRLGGDFRVPPLEMIGQSEHDTLEACMLVRESETGCAYDGLEPVR
jgi:hypothetical protein